MNTRIKKNRVKRYKAPVPIPPPRPSRPKRSILKSIYKELITSDRDQRVEALKKAMHWYESLQAYLSYHSELKMSQLKAKTQAERERLVGLNSNNSQVKEERYIAAIREYEKLGRTYGPPKIGVYLSKYSHVRSKLEARKRRLVNKFGEFLALLDRVLKPKNYMGKRIELRVNKISSRWRVDSEGNVTFDRKFLDTAKRTSRTDGLLPGVLMLLPGLTEAAAMSVERDAVGHRTGRFTIHGMPRYIATLEMLDLLVKYSLTDGAKKLIRRHKLAQSEEMTSAA